MTHTNCTPHIEGQTLPEVLDSLYQRCCLTVITDRFDNRAEYAICWIKKRLAKGGLRIAIIDEKNKVKDIFFKGSEIVNVEGLK